MNDLFNYNRRLSSVTLVGDTPMGGSYPIRIQSMATTSTNDTEASVEQAKRIIEAGGEYVRFTTQGTREAENMRNISGKLKDEGYNTPLVADVHFNPLVAEVAAKYCEKVRINPGNYTDPARTFKKLEYTDSEYQQELKKIENRLLPLLNICRQHHTALRIGVNHGSLSDRIMSRYGDTPEGIVESCMEFLRICKREKFNDVVISIKASNTVVMVRSMRMLTVAMKNEDMNYPLHLGVTEAGEGEDGRIKSAVGIGTLLADGIGDTVRVSLSEEPEEEIPVARHLVDHFTKREGHAHISASRYDGFDFLKPERRKTYAVDIIGGNNVPVVVAEGNCAEDFNKDTCPDFIYTRQMPDENAKQKFIVDFNVYNGQNNTFPIFPQNAMPWIGSVNAKIKFLTMQYGANPDEYIACLKRHPEVVVVCMSQHQNPTGQQRALLHQMMTAGVENPVVMWHNYNHNSEGKSNMQIEAAADMGALMMDGLADGVWISNSGNIVCSDIADTAFAILQAARLRTSKTEYISCPGCGRTLYDLQKTIAQIKAATAHLKGLKIGIMGCIVNGPGEMADADYGYVGAGPGRISLYRKKECVEKNIPENMAVEKLLQLIENDTKSSEKK